MKSLDDTRHDHIHPATDHRTSDDQPAARTTMPAASIRRSALASPRVSEPSNSFATAINMGIHQVARSASGDELAPHAVSAIDRASTSSGSSLPGHLQRKFESSLGVDLSGVRVHTGESSQEAAGSVSARAYALGQDVHFGAGHYNPSSSAGEHLLAHEVAHTVQQRGGSVSPKFQLEVSGPGDACEHEADAAADAMVSGAAFQIGGGGAQIARDPAMTPAQDAALRRAQHGSARSLGALEQGEIVALATTLQAAFDAQHGPLHGQIARALVTLYDAMDVCLQRRWDGGEDTGMAFEITPFSMIDVWTAEARAPHRARHRRPPRAHGPTPAPTPVPTGAPPPPPPTAMAAPVPAPSVDGIAPAHADEGHTGEALHHVATAAEATHTAIDIALLFHAVETGLGVGGAALFGVEIAAAALAALGTGATGLATIVAGDEYGQALTNAQERVVHTCSAFAHVIRGENPGSGVGIAEGTRAGRAALAAMPPGVTPAQIAAALPLRELYMRAWPRVTNGLVSRLVEGTHGGVVNAFDMASEAIRQTAAGGRAFYRFAPSD